MLLLNCKLHLELNWTKNSVMGNVATATTFQIIGTKLYVPVITLQSKEKIKLTKLLPKGFKRSVFWNEYKSKIETQDLDNKNLQIILLESSFQKVNGLFVLAYDNTESGNNRVERDSHQKYFLPRINLIKSNVLVDGCNFYDQPISDKIRKYDEVRKLTIGKCDDYTTECLLDYKYFRDHFLIAACNLQQQKELDADPRSVQQIEANFMLNINSQILPVLQKSKDTLLEFYKGTAKLL